MSTIQEIFDRLNEDFADDEYTLSVKQTGNYDGYHVKIDTGEGDLESRGLTFESAVSRFLEDYKVWIKEINDI